MVIVNEDGFEPGELLSSFSAGRRGSGAVVSFSGLCRAHTDGVETGGLYLDAYPSYTRAEIERIESEARTRFAIDDVIIHHRYGQIAPGEAIVFVGVAAAHRRAAFEAADYLMDQLKTRAPFWKKESGAGGDVWLEPKPEEQVRAERWSVSA